MLISISGPRYSIAECGEQLAWLGAAMKSPSGRPNTVSWTTCSIESQDGHEWLTQYSVDLSPRMPRLFGAQTAQRLCGATIIRGFPTKKRPPLFSGLELGNDCMLDCIGAPVSPVFENGRVVLKGCYQTLELVKHTQNVSLWHVVHPCSIACSFSECPSQSEHDIWSSENGLQNEILTRENRHIIANMEYFGVPVVDPGQSP